MISREDLNDFSTAARDEKGSESSPIGFDMESYLSRHGFKVSRRKPWQSKPGAFVFELEKCPFNPDHVSGSAAFTLADGCVCLLRVLQIPAWIVNKVINSPRLEVVARGKGGREGRPMRIVPNRAVLA